MSKNHPGINQWKQHIQLGRRKPKAGGPQSAGGKPQTKSGKPRFTGGQSDDEPVTDTRKPPGWRGRAAKAKDRRADQTAPAAPQAVLGKPQLPSHGARPGQPVTAGKPPEAVIRPAKAPVERPLDGEGRPYITLVQFLKTVDVVGTGGAGKHAVRAGGILVNGTEELRPGRKLHAGDVVVVAGTEHRVAL
jgi:ribosome-associated protein YbcJ (S4-like RNA binding protein)